MTIPSRNARLEEIDGRPALRFERALPHSPERVWEHLTDPEKQFAWHPTPARFEARPGGHAEFVAGGHVEGMQVGLVTDYEPPRLLGYTWPADGEEDNHLRWELRPEDEGCVLVLVHSFEDRLKSARDGAGWHLCLDSLEADLDSEEAAGVPSPAPGSPWARLNSEYQRRFGISPGEATPPPARPVDRGRVGGGDTRPST
jgi:uncharacterized protein YndB with AHSA1/START domain